MHLRFKPKNNAVFKEIVCTSSTRFIRVFSMLKESDKKHALKKTANDGIRTKDKHSILTYNLLENKYNTVSLDFWEIVNFLTITPANIEVLDQAMNEMLKRPIEKDVHKDK